MKTETFISTQTFESNVGTSYSIGWGLMQKFFLELLLLMVISFAAQIPIQLMSRGLQASGATPVMIFGGLLAVVFSFLISNPISYGINYVNLKLVRGEKFDVADVFAGFKENYLNVILSALLTMVIVMAGFVLLIIPGIIFACKLAFVPYLVMDKKLDAVEAVKTSWEMTNGHSFTIFLMFLLAIPIVLLGLLLLVVGILPARIWISAASAALYHAVDLELNPKQTEKVIEDE